MKSKVWVVIAIVALLALAVFLAQKPRIRGELPEQLTVEESAEPPEVVQEGVGPAAEAEAPETTAPKRKVSQDYLKFIQDNLVGGGPPKDGIPSIDNPVYLSAEEANLAPDELVFGIDYRGEVLAFPQDIMYWHEIVNENIGGEKVSVTYCPLTGSIIGYKGKELGVSGKLYNSNLVMYDRASDARVPQILGAGIEGSLEGEFLEKFPVVVTTWGKWKAQHPTTKVLSRETGFDRDYDRNPYPGYDDALRVWFPLAARSDKFETKKIVYGIKHNGEELAVPKAEFRQVGEDTVALGGESVTLKYNEKLDVVQAFADEELPAIPVYWFAWYAYYPDTKVWE